VRNPAALPQPDNIMARRLEDEVRMLTVAVLRGRTAAATEES